MLLPSNQLCVCPPSSRNLATGDLHTNTIGFICLQKTLQAVARLENTLVECGSPSGTRKFDRGLMQQLLHADLHWLDVPECAVKYKLCTKSMWQIE